MRRLNFLSIFLIVLLSALRAEATTYTVKTSGGDYTTIQACAASAGAGDTCVIYAGSYSGWTQARSGTAGNPITFAANTGDTVTVTGGITISGQSYLTFSYLTLNGTITGDGSSSHNTITHCKSTATLFKIMDGQGSNGSDNVLSYNVIDLSGQSGNAEGFYVYGDRNRFEHNEIKNGQGDCHDLGGMNVVVRNEFCHDINGASGEHIDFIQVMGGGTTPTLTFSLIENNVEQHCYNDSGNCHFVIIRTGGPVADGNIIRYNFAQNLNGSGISLGGVGDNVPNAAVYNNTLATEALLAENGDMVSCQNAPYAIIANNIAYNVEAGGWSPTGCAPSSDQSLLVNGTLAYTSGFSGSWNSPYSTEGTYSALSNKNPLFANYPTDGTLQSASPARNAGVALASTTNSGTASTSLTVTNIHAFQPGWAGSSGDCIRVGASTTTCVTAVNYSSNTLTVSPAISWSNGTSVYLYKDSSGRVILNSANPDVGAFPYGAGTAPPPAPPPTSGAPNPPTNLTVTVN